MADDLWHKAKPGPNETPVKCGCGGPLRVPSAKHGRGKRWRARVNDPNGELLQPSFRTETEAKAFEDRVREEVRRGEYVDPATSKVPLETYAAEWLAAQTFGASSHESVERRLRLHILPILGKHLLRTLEHRPSLIQAWIKGLRLSPNSARHMVFTLASILNAAVDDKLINRNPCHVKSVKPPEATHKRVQPWVTGQVEVVRELITDEYAAAVDVGYGMGLRQGEMFGLAVDDIDWLEFKAHIQRQVKTVGNTLVFGPPKYEQIRDVPVEDPLPLRLSAHLQRWPAREVTLPWETPDGPPVTARLIFPLRWRQQFNRDHWKPALVRAGLPATREHGFHHLRHTFASALLAAGADILLVAALLGHKDPAFTLRIYTHLMPSSDERARMALGRMRSGDHRAQIGHSTQANATAPQRHGTTALAQVIALPGHVSAG